MCQQYTTKSIGLNLNYISDDKGSENRSAACSANLQNHTMNA